MHAIVFICFLVSGATGLIFENLWVRMLTLVFGSTSLAVSSVLTAYMGGLALGSWILGRRVDRVRDPIRVYAALELMVGVLGLLVPLVIRGVYPALNSWLWSRFEPGFFAFSFLRFLFSVALLVIPTTLMGGTLPVLSRVLVRGQEEVDTAGSRVGLLYAMNTAGAVIGTFLGGFVLMPHLGLSLSNLTASLANVVLIGVPLWIAAPAVARALENRRALARQVAEAISRMAATDADPAAMERPGRVGRAIVLVAFGVSGLAAMNTQVIWSRVLSMVIGSSVYAFAVILMAFLVGIAIGSSILSAILRRGRIARPVTWLAVVNLVIAAAAVLDYFLVDSYPFWFAGIVTRIHGYEKHVWLVQAVMFGVAAMALLPLTIGMGTTLPLTVSALTTDDRRVGRDVGDMYAVNTLGAIAGSFGSAFVFVPGLSRLGLGYGLQWSYLLSVALGVALFATLILAVRRTRARIAAAVAAPLLLAATVALVIGTGRMWDPAKITIGPFRVSLADDILDKETWGQPEIVYYFDGVSTTVSVERWGKHIALKNNGKVDASSGDDMVTQIMISAYPLFFHPRTPAGDVDVAIVGFGSGVTVGAALDFPVASVKAVELEPAVVEGSRAFEEVNHLSYGVDGWPWVVKDGLEILSNDGRNFLVSGAHRYDVIVSEPSNPWITGVSNLFTIDHYRAARSSLDDGGIYCQWVQLYEMSLGNVKTLFKTFATVFPYVVVFASDPMSSDTVMLGSFDPIVMDLGRAQALWRDPDVARAMEAAEVADPHDIIGRIIFSSREEVLEFCGDAPVNTDDNAIIEFAAPRDLIGYSRNEKSTAALYKDDWPYGRPWPITSGYGDGAEGSENLAALALALASSGRYGIAGEVLTRSGGMGPTEMNGIAVVVLANLTSDENDPTVTFDLPVPALAMDENESARFWTQYNKAVDAIVAGDAEASLVELLEIPEVVREHSGSSMRFLEAYLLYYTGEFEEAIRMLDDLSSDPEGYARDVPAVYYYLAKAYDRSYDYPSAVREMKNYVLMELARRMRQKADGASAGTTNATETGTIEDGGEEKDRED
mgnify:CR=1 FL=1